MAFGHVTWILHIWLHGRAQRQRGKQQRQKRQRYVTESKPRIAETMKTMKQLRNVCQHNAHTPPYGKKYKDEHNTLHTNYI